MLGLAINAIAAFLLSYLIVSGVVFIALVVVMLFHKPQSSSYSHSVDEDKNILNNQG